MTFHLLIAAFIIGTVDTAIPQYTALLPQVPTPFSLILNERFVSFFSNGGVFEFCEEDVLASQET